MPRPRKIVDQTKLCNLALIGLSNEKIAQTLGVSRDTLERRYRAQIEQARGDGETRILAKIFQAAMAGSMAALQLCAINRCGWSRKPVTVVNVTQHAGLLVDTRSPEQIKAHLVELQKAVLEECRRQSPELFLPPGR